MDKKRVYDCLNQLWLLVSTKLYSRCASNEQAQACLHNEIIAYIDMIQESYKVSNKTINQILYLAETKNHFKHYFSNIFSVDDILINPDLDVKMLITIN